MNRARRFIIAWCALAAVASVLCAAVEVAAQQSFRRGADDPQVALAEDAARSHRAALATVAALRGSPPREIATSLAPWVALSGRDRRPIAASATLDGTFPVLPDGVYHWVADHGEDRITWQPRNGVRVAAIVTRTPEGDYVVAGRSLREIESREASLVAIVGIAWLLAVTGCGIAAAVLTGS